MANVLTRSLARIFRDRARLTSVSRLKREGFRTVSVLDMSELEELVGAAIERVVHRTTQDPEKGSRMAADAQVEFMKMIGEKDALERHTQELKRERNLLEANLTDLQNALKEARGQMVQSVKEHDREILEELCAKLNSSVDEILTRSAEGLDETTAGSVFLLKAPLVDAMTHILGSAVRRYEPHGVGEEAGTKVETLQRRINKLNASLENARSMLDRLRDNRSSEDDGIASIYREAQGLKEGAEDYGTRRKLMTAIFKLNLDLKKEIETSRES